MEQLAAASGVSVDTVRYYQSKGLLDPPRREGRVAWYRADHLDRIVRIRSLQARGFTLATIVRLVNGDLDAADEALVAELSAAPAGTAPTPTDGAGAPDADRDAGGGRPPGAEELFTLTELADRTGVPLALLKAVEAEGLLVPRRVGTGEWYTHEDVEAARAGLRLLEWGVPLSSLLDLSRRHHVATEAVAREAVSLFSTHVRGTLRERSDGSTPEEEAARLVQAYAELLPAVNTLVGHHFTRTLLRAAIDHIEQEGSEIEREAVLAEASAVTAGNGRTTG